MAIPCSINPQDRMFLQHNFVWNVVEYSSFVITQFNIQQPTKVALILETDWNYSTAFVYDPYEILPPHRTDLRPYFENLAWRNPRFPKPQLSGITHFTDMHGGLPIAAHWFIEEPFTPVNKILTEAWASEFSSILYGELPITNDRKLPSTLKTTMSQLAPQVVQHCLSVSVGDGSQQVSKGFVDLSIAVNSATEEGEPPRGSLVLLPVEEPLNVGFKKSREPSIKQCVKLLGAVKDTNYGLIIDKSGIRGLSELSQLKGQRLTAEFDELGCTLAINGKLTANIRGQHLFRSEGQPYLKVLHDELSSKFACDSTELEKIVEHIVEGARTGAFGCTIAIFAPISEALLGAYFDGPKNFGDLEALLKGMAHVDGAIHINPSGEIMGFGVLLDGLSAPGLENPDKGARHNSAIRFTNQNQKSVIVVVSEDGPVTIFSGGKSAQQKLVLTNPGGIGPVPNLNEWMQE